MPKITNTTVFISEIILLKMSSKFSGTLIKVSNKLPIILNISLNELRRVLTAEKNKSKTVDLNAALRTKVFSSFIKTYCAHHSG